MPPRWEVVVSVLQTIIKYSYDYFFLLLPVRYGVFVNDSREPLMDFYFELLTDRIMPLMDLVK